MRAKYRIAANAACSLARNKLNSMRVYKPKLQVDKFRSLLAKDENVHKIEVSLMSMDGTSKLEQWPESLEAVFDGKRRPMPDIVSCEAGNMLLWGRSLEILRDHLPTNCELLPVHWDGGHGLLVNVLGQTDCLDEEKTEWVYHPSGTRMWIEKPAFIAEQVPDAILFKIEQECIPTFTPEHEAGKTSLKSLVQQHGLTGLRFDCVWSDE